jgi:hypothetical protein
LFYLYEKLAKQMVGTQKYVTDEDDFTETIISDKAPYP